MSNIEIRTCLGFKGERGYSAYETAVQNGFVGNEKDWLATLGTASYYDQNANIYTTVQTNETQIPLPDSYTSNSFIDIYVDGLRLNTQEYSIDINNKTIELVNPIETIGTKVETVIMTMATNSLPIVSEITENSTNETVPGSKCIYDIKTDLEEELSNTRVPTGGNAGQVLAKRSSDNNDVEWIDRISNDDLNAMIADLKDRIYNVELSIYNVEVQIQEACKGTILYDNATGTTERVDLSDDLSNYDEFEVEYYSGNTINGTHFFMSSGRLSTSRTSIYLNAVEMASEIIGQILVAGISNHNTYLNKNHEFYANVGASNAVGRQSQIYITKVKAYKY